MRTPEREDSLASALANLEHEEWRDRNAYILGSLQAYLERTPAGLKALREAAEGADRMVLRYRERAATARQGGADATR